MAASLQFSFMQFFSVGLITLLPTLRVSFQLSAQVARSVFVLTVKRNVDIAYHGLYCNVMKYNMPRKICRNLQTLHFLPKTHWLLH